MAKGMVTGGSWSPFQMHRCAGLLLASMICCAALSETFGLVLSAKEKRGWTVNSAGYLLGPRRIEQLLKDMPSARGREALPGEYAIDRIFNDKHGLAGKRDIQPEETIKAGTFGRPQVDDSVVRTVIEFLTYLHLKETGALENISTAVSSEETNQS